MVCCEIYQMRDKERKKFQFGWLRRRSSSIIQSNSIFRSMRICSRSLRMFIKSSKAMSPFFAVIFLHGLCLANAINAINFTTVYEWDNFDFIRMRPSEADNSTGGIDLKFYSDYIYPRYMAVFGERLFLSLDFGIPATLVWLPTSSTSTEPPKLAPFPSWDLHKKDNCDTIQWAKGLQADTDGRLWVLDNGSSNCPSKLWIFDLVNNDTTERVHQFPHTVVSHSIGGRRMYDMVLDKNPDDDLAYITDYHSEHIVVYSRNLDKSWTVKTPGRTWFSLALSPNREERQLYLKKSSSKELYSVSVSELKNEGGSAASKLIGEFAEFPFRMVIDSANVLYAAFYRKTHLTKWNISEPFREQNFYGTRYLDSNWPFTFAFDSNDTFWLTVRDETDQINYNNRHKLLKAAVGARYSAVSPSTSTDSVGGAGSSD